MSCRCSKTAAGQTETDNNQIQSGLPVRISVALLRCYKRYISPLLPPSCRFTPTCSEYAVEAVQRHGVIRGLMLALFRLFRCHPFAKGGYDPVK